MAPAKVHTVGEKQAGGHKKGQRGKFLMKGSQIANPRVPRDMVKKRAVVNK